MNVKSKYNKLWLGLVLGIIIPIITIIIFSLFKSDVKNLIEFIEFTLSISALSNILSLCALPNLAIFYLFLNKELYYSARGVIFATLLWAILVVITRYFI
jgi:hypothetical protein